MKTRILLFAVTTVMLSACVDDFHGSGPDEVVVNEENHLSADDLYRQYAEEEIPVLENILTNPGQFTDQEVEDAQNELDQINYNFENLVDIYMVTDIPRPCPRDEGKCVPRFLEYFIFRTDIQRAAVIATYENGQKTVASDELNPLPDVDGQLQYIQLPLQEIEGELKIEIIWQDSNDIATTFTVLRNND